MEKTSNFPPLSSGFFKRYNTPSSFLNGLLKPALDGGGGRISALVIWEPDQPDMFSLKTIFDFSVGYGDTLSDTVTVFMNGVETIYRAPKGKTISIPTPGVEFTFEWSQRNWRFMGAKPISPLTIGP